MLFKSDDLTIKKLDKLKKQNQDMYNVFSWLEEYSTIKIRQKDGIAKVKLAKSLSSTDDIGDIIPLSAVKSLLEKENNINYPNTTSIMSNFSEESDSHIGESTREGFNNDGNFISFSEDCINKIEDQSFDIFNLEREVGASNTLSVISCYIFTTMGLYSVVKYDKFEAFIQSVTKGYGRENPYHNVKYIILYQ
jgi:hypothetical protein